MGFKARPPRSNDAAIGRRLDAMARRRKQHSKRTDTDAVSDGVDTYAPCLIDFLADYEMEPDDVFESDDLQIVEPEDQSIFHFCVGYITCAAAMFKVSPTDLINGYIEDN